MLKLLIYIILLGFAWAGGWHTSFESALEEAKKERKNILIYFYSSHCPYCVYMEEFVFGDPEVDEFMKRNFVVVSVSVDENKELKKKFGVIGTPYIVVYDPFKNREVLKIFGSRYKEDFLSFLSLACKKTNLRRC